MFASVNNKIINKIECWINMNAFKNYRNPLNAQYTQHLIEPSLRVYSSSVSKLNLRGTKFWCIATFSS